MRLANNYTHYYREQVSPRRGEYNDSEVSYRYFVNRVCCTVGLARERYCASASWPANVPARRRGNGREISDPAPGYPCGPIWRSPTWGIADHRPNGKWRGHGSVRE